MPNKFVSNGNLRNLLGGASSAERLEITNVLSVGAMHPYDAITLQEKICLTGGHGFSNWIRGQGTGYIDIVDDVVDALKIKGLLGRQAFYMEGHTLQEIDNLVNIRLNKMDIETCRRLADEYLGLAEKAILLKILQTTYEKLDATERKQFDDKVGQIAKQFGSNDPSGKLAGGAGLLVIGNLGGFATYTLMSSVLSTLSLGSLGFGAYTAASSALSVVLGPVGWLALGAAGIYSFGKPELQKTIPLVAMIGMVRQRLSN